MVENIGLLVAHKPDSQDICFVPDGDYATYKKKTLRQVQCLMGNFVTSDGTIVGQHKGIIHYTVGQKRSWIISGDPAFVLEIRPETNEEVWEPMKNQCPDMYVLIM